MPKRYVVTGPPELVGAKHREPPPMDHEPGWEESAFSEEMGRLILDRVLAGETVREITADPRMPSYATVYRWTHVIPEFGAAWRQTRTLTARLERAAEAEETDGLRRAKAAAAVANGKRPRDWASGRRSTYTPERAAAVCEAIRDGASLSEVVARPGMPSFKVVYRWLKRFPAFRGAYAEACDWREGWIEFQAQLIAEESNIVTLRAARASRPWRAAPGGCGPGSTGCAEPPASGADRMAGRVSSRKPRADHR